jgi:hypothetical protein
MTRAMRVSLALLGLMQIQTAIADVCAVDDAPAATLLYPYFEVDLAGSPTAGLTTTMWLRNEDSDARLAQVNLWGDYHRAAMGFQVYLPAGATVRINLADVLLRGVLPRTGRAVSPVGQFDADGSNVLYPGCNNGPDPGDGPPVANQLSAQFLADVQLRLSGRPSPSTGRCFGFNYGDNVARGFITVDAINVCTTNLPTDAGYYVAGGLGIASNANVLSGGYALVDPGNNFAQGARAASLEAAPAGTFVPGDVTFHSRFTAGVPTDEREPLPGRWAVAFGNGGVEAVESELLAWRGAPPFNPNQSACNFQVPPWFPLQDMGRVPFDATGDTPPEQITFPGQVPPLPEPIGLATQRFPTPLINDALQYTVDSGSALLALHAVAPGYPVLPEGQAWVGVLRSSQGRFSDLVPGTAMDSFCSAGQTTPANVSGPLASNPVAPHYIFADNYETSRFGD